MQERVVIETVPGRLQAEILRAMLEAKGIAVWLSQESAAAAIGLAMGPLAQVDLLVEESQAQAALAVLDDYRAGRLGAGEEAQEPP